MLFVVTERVWQSLATRSDGCELFYTLLPIPYPCLYSFHKYRGKLSEKKVNGFGAGHNYVQQLEFTCKLVTEQ